MSLLNVITFSHVKAPHAKNLLYYVAEAGHSLHLKCLIFHSPWRFIYTLYCIYCILYIHTAYINCHGKWWWFLLKIQHPLHLMSNQLICFWMMIYKAHQISPNLSKSLCLLIVLLLQPTGPLFYCSVLLLPLWKPAAAGSCFQRKGRSFINSSACAKSLWLCKTHNCSSRDYSLQPESSFSQQQHFGLG